MNELGSLGLILLFALLIGHLVQFARVPEVTGYLVAGMIVGPHGLGWITLGNLHALQVFSQLGLGLILFSIGATFNLRVLRRNGRALARVGLAESMLTALLVTSGMLVLGQPVGVALLLGAIAVETGAASTLMVLREGNARGPLTDVVTGVIGMNNILALVAFSIVAAGLQLHAAAAAAHLDLGVIYVTLFPLIWQFVGSAALGFLIGLLLASWATQVVESGETLILMIGCVLLTVGIATYIEASPLVASLVVGATVSNLSARSRRLFDALSRTDPPLYVIFFVLAGAELDLRLLPGLGVVGVVYVLCRAAGKLGGSYIAATPPAYPPEIRRLLGASILAQAGLAIGLVLITRDRFPEFSVAVATVVLGAVAVFEIAGPLSARFALGLSGEMRPQEEGAQGGTL